MKSPSSPLTEYLKNSSLTSKEDEVHDNVTLKSIETDYEITRKYDFFVPTVEVVCQCTCTSNNEEQCSYNVDYKCAHLVNSTTICTIHNTISTDLSFCNKFYQLCCQVYFSKTKSMNPFKAFHLAYHRSLLKVEIFPKSLDLKLNAYNVTVTENVKNVFISPDRVLHISEFSPMRNLPDSWYFIEDGSNELKYSDAINAIDETNMNKIGWFQYNKKQKELSRVSRPELKEHLQIKPLDCHSNRPKYEWKLDATHFVTKGLLHLPTYVEKVSDMYEDISKISINLKEEKINLETLNLSGVKFTLSDVSSFPFMFTSSIKENVLNLTFFKGSGTFDVKITSPLWTNEFSFSTECPGKILILPPMNYDSCWICVYQDSQQLCQVLFLVSGDEFNYQPSITSTKSPIEGLKNKSNINNQKFPNETDISRNITLSTSENAYNKDIPFIVTISVLAFVVGVLAWVILIRKKMWKLQKPNANDQKEKVPLSSIIERSTLDDTKSRQMRRYSDGLVTEREMVKISEKISGDERTNLLEELNLSIEEHDQFENMDAFDILILWKERNGMNATRNVLKKALAAMRKEDIVKDVLNRESKQTNENDDGRNS